MSAFSSSRGHHQVDWMGDSHLPMIASATNQRETHKTVGVPVIGSVVVVFNAADRMQGCSFFGSGCLGLHV